MAMTTFSLEALEEIDILKRRLDALENDMRDMAQATADLAKVVDKHTEEISKIWWNVAGFSDATHGLLGLMKDRLERLERRFMQ